MLREREIDRNSKEDKDNHLKEEIKKLRNRETKTIFLER